MPNFKFDQQFWDDPSWENDDEREFVIVNIIVDFLEAKNTLKKGPERTRKEFEKYWKKLGGPAHFARIEKEEIYIEALVTFFELRSKHIETYKHDWEFTLKDNTIIHLSDDGYFEDVTDIIDRELSGGVAKSKHAMWRR